jgi:hypothetical protein
MVIEAALPAAERQQVGILDKGLLQGSVRSQGSLPKAPLVDRFPARF